jgi:hypothetical protein
MKIRSVSITYSIRKSRDEKEKTLKLENDIQILENQIKSKSHCVYSGIFESEKGGNRKSEAEYSRGFTSSISGQLA